MSIIKNAGYMWHRKYVDWQGGNDLIGYPEIGKGSTVNFANQAAIYALYDPNLRCIYIGQAGRGEFKGLYHRLKDHVLMDHLFCMWERFSWFGFYSTKALLKEQYDKEFEVTTDINELMNIIEALVIRVNPPSFNISLGTLQGIDWYYQEAEFEEQQAQFEKLKKVCKSLRKK